MSVKITKGDLKQVQLFVNLCDRLGLDYKTHHSLQRKALKLMETREQAQEPTLDDKFGGGASKSIYETTKEAISNWWSSWGTLPTEDTAEDVQEEEEAEEEVLSFDEKVAEILIALLEERAEKVVPHRESTVIYDECEC